MSIKGYNKMRIPDQNGGDSVELEVNFSKIKKLKKCIQVSIGKKTAIIPFQFLHEFVALVSDEDEQVALARVKKDFVRKIIRSHIVELNQDVKKGETVTIKCITDVPDLIYQEMELKAAQKVLKSQVEDK